MASNKKLLVVEDSPLFRVSMSNFLKTHYAFEIEEFNSVRELTEFLKKTDPEEILLIILDQYLPDGTGLEAISSYMEEHENYKLPFILVSASVDKETVTRAFKQGAKDVITKPVNYEKLKERLDNIIAPEYMVKEKKSIMDYYSQIMNEVKRARRGDYNLSIAMAGIFQKTDFKSIHKESFYRQIIDLEKKYPDELQKTMRETDTIVSLSPSEYLFILPFTDKKGTEVIVKKISTIFDQLVSEEERKNLVMVTGTSTYPDDGDSLDKLIAKIEEDFKKQSVQQAENSNASHGTSPDAAGNKPEKPGSS